MHVVFLVCSEEIIACIRHFGCGTSQDVGMVRCDRGCTGRAGVNATVAGNQKASFPDHIVVDHVHNCVVGRNRVGHHSPGGTGPGTDHGDRSLGEMILCRVDSGRLVVVHTSRRGSDSAVAESDDCRREIESYWCYCSLHCRRWSLAS